MPKHIPGLYALSLFGLLLASGLLPAPAPAEHSRDAARFRLDLMRVPLSDLCWVLEKRTGIPHTPADTATGDLTLSALGEMTPVELRQATAEVLGIAWKLLGRGPEQHYVAERTPASLAEEARVLAEMERAFRDGLRGLVEAASLPEEKRKELPRDLMRRVEGNSGEAARLLGVLPSADQARLLAGDTIVHPVSALPPAARQSLAALASGLNAGLPRLNGSAEAGRVRVPEPIDLQNGARWSVRIAPVPFLFPGVMSFEVGLSSPAHPGIGVGVNVRVPDLVANDRRGLRLSRSVTTGSSSPALAEVPSGYAVRVSLWSQILRELEHGLQRPVVSDAYIPDYLGPVRPPPARPGETVETFLDRACRAWGCRWGHIDGVLTFQRVDWPQPRRAQIPESVARNWRRRMIDTGRLSVNDLAAMAALTPPQTVALPQIVAGQADLVAEHRDLLLLWKSLPGASRRKLTSSGLFLTDLPLAAKPLATSLLTGALGTDAPLVLASAQMRAATSDEAFTFTITAPEHPPVERRLDLRCRPEWVKTLRQQEAERTAALRAAAGVPEGGRGGS